jgi:hypothetical protein
VKLRSFCAALAAAGLFLGCANSPPLIAPALLAEAKGKGTAKTVSLNFLSNYGKTGYADTVAFERGDGQSIKPTYRNVELMSTGSIWLNEYGFFAFFLPNLQLQAYGGLRWGRHAALGYFPTFTLTGRHMLHGCQLDLNGFDRIFLSAGLYEENFPSSYANSSFMEPVPLKTLAVGSLFLHIPWRVGTATVWVIPNYRRAISHPSLARYGANLAFSLALSRERK